MVSYDPFDEYAVESASEVDAAEEEHESHHQLDAERARFKHLKSQEHSSSPSLGPAAVRTRKDGSNHINFDRNLAREEKQPVTADPSESDAPEHPSAFGSSKSCDKPETLCLAPCRFGEGDDGPSCRVADCKVSNAARDSNDADIHPSIPCQATQKSSSLPKKGKKNSCHLTAGKKMV